MTAPTRIAIDSDSTGAVNVATLACDMQTVIAAAALAGDRVYAYCSCDGVATQSVSSGAGWNKKNQQADALSGGTQMNLATFEFDVVTNGTVPDLTIAFGASQMAVVREVLVRPPAGSTLAATIYATVGGDGTNPDPPAATNSSGASIDALVIAAAGADANGTGATAVMTGGPSGYNNIGRNSVGNSQGTTLSLADLAVTIANGGNEDPTAWTHVAEQWAASTALIYGVSSGTPVGRADGTNTSLALSAVQITAAGLATATNTALALSGVQLRAVGLSSDTETALALTPVQVAAAGTATETDAAQALSAVQISGVGRSDETDNALGLGSARPAGVANDNETALALSAGSSAATGRADETDAALALAAVQATGVELASETDQALPLGVSVQVGIATETDTALELAGVVIVGAPVPERRTTYASPVQQTAANDILTTYASPAPTRTSA